MDTLALLCNLYGDGPKTLASLRRNGVPDLPSLLTQEASDVADWIGAKSAKRFLREAQLLHERIDAEQEEDDGRSEVEEREELLAPVLDRWREQDRSAPPAATRRPAPSPVAPAQEDVFVGTPLEAGVLQGLDEDWVRRLAAAGVHDVETLAAGRGDELAVRAGVPFTRVLRLVFLARRYVEAAPASSAPAHAAPAPQPAPADRVPVQPQRASTPSSEPARPRGRSSFGRQEERFSPSERPEAAQAPAPDTLEPGVARWPRNGGVEREKPSDGAGPFA